MVNGPLPGTMTTAAVLAAFCERAAEPNYLLTARTPRQRAPRAFGQILGKLFFFELLENLRRIVLDYGQKHPRPANGAFNAAC
jgi:hypothetical protein